MFIFIGGFGLVAGLKRLKKRKKAVHFLCEKRENPLKIGENLGNSESSSRQGVSSPLDNQEFRPKLRRTGNLT